MSRVVAKADESRAGVRCPFCHDELREDEKTWQCAACKAVHHWECAKGYGRCAVHACRSGPALVQLREKPIQHELEAVAMPRDLTVARLVAFTVWSLLAAGFAIGGATLGVHFIIRPVPGVGIAAALAAATLLLGALACLAFLVRDLRARTFEETRAPRALFWLWERVVRLFDAVTAD